MNRTALGPVFAVLAIAVVCVLPCGCNDDAGNPTGDEFRVTPSSAELLKSGDAVVLQAVGGLEPLRWTTTETNGSMGTLSGDGRTVTYTRGARNGANVIQVTDKRTWTASATIFQNAAPTGTSKMVISPATVSLNENRDTAVFIANGGSGTYAWTVADGQLGHLSGRDGTQVVYTRDRAGDNSVILNDSDGNAATATITQPDLTANLAISPGSAALTKNGDTAVFTLSGGTAPFAWRVADTANGHLDTSEGTTAVYTRDADGPNSVIVSDRFGETVTAAINQADPANLTIVPGSATLNFATDTVVFAANGGLPPYQWSVADASRGSLNAAAGSTVTYTRVGPGNNTVTLRDSDSHVATAVVSQPNFALAIVPSSASLGANNDTIVLTASGGLPPFAWSVADLARGKLNVYAGSPVVYTRLTSGNNSVTLSDASGQSVTLAVSQPTVAPLAVSPTTANVSTNAGTQVFTAGGGVGVYTWSFAAPQHGTMIPAPPAVGSSIVYVSNTGDTAGDVIQVTDGVSTVFATVTKH